MKLRKLSLVLAAIAIATFLLAGSASADPPKEDFYFRWGYFVDGHGCEDFRVTGTAAHCPDQWYKVQIYSTTNPLVSGMMEFWFDTDNLAQPSGDWYLREQFQGGWRIHPDGIDGYWEGNLTSIRGWFDWYVPISRMEGRGYGALDGWLLKGYHWMEPAEPGTSPYGWMWPVNGGELIRTGRAK